MWKNVRFRINCNHVCVAFCYKQQKNRFHNVNWFSKPAHRQSYAAVRKLTCDGIRIVCLLFTLIVLSYAETRLPNCIYHGNRFVSYCFVTHNHAHHYYFWSHYLRTREFCFFINMRNFWYVTFRSVFLCGPCKAVWGDSEMNSKLDNVVIENRHQLQPFVCCGPSSHSWFESQTLSPRLS